MMNDLVIEIAQIATLKGYEIDGITDNSVTLIDKGKGINLYLHVDYDHYNYVGAPSPLQALLDYIKTVLVAR